MEVQVGTVGDPVLAGKLISGGWYQNDRLRTVGMAVLRAARFTCSACGFPSRPSKQVPHGWMVPVNPEHPAMLALEKTKGRCLCPFCASCQAINWAVRPVQGGSRSEHSPGRLIYLPEMSQEQVNRVAHCVVAISSARSGANQSAEESAARDIDAAFLAKHADLQRAVPVFHEDMDYEFANALALLPAEFYELREEVIGGVRWWPHYKYWAEQGYFWSRATFEPLRRI